MADTAIDGATFARLRYCPCPATLLCSVADPTTGCCFYIHSSTASTWTPSTEQGATSSENELNPDVVPRAGVQRE